MRMLLIAAILVGGSATAWSDEFPWCVQLDVFTKSCRFARYDECAAAAKDATTPATGAARCIRNPQYQAPAAAAPGKAAAGRSAKKQP